MAPEALFRILSDPTRLRILALLATHEELCVCDLTRTLGLSQPLISRHLAQLRAAALVSDRREGVWIHYRLHPNLPGWAQKVTREILASLMRQEPYSSDRKVLRTTRRRRGHCA